MNSDVLRIIPLGGFGEVGRNMMLYEYGSHILVVDAGMMFPENDMIGVDYIIPDLTYLIQRKKDIRGVIITHGHEDHIGAIQHLVEFCDAPIYATALTRGLLDVKLARNGMADRADLHTISAGDRIQIGPFGIEFFHVCHSIPDGVGLGIDTPQGLIIHTGDYKFDHTPVDGKPSDYAKISDISRRGVLALVADSTNAERPGWTPSEKVVDAAFEDVFKEAQGRVIIASFASLISRMQQAANVAEKYGRKLAVVGASMVDNLKMARKLGYLEFSDQLLIPIDRALQLPAHEVAILCTGSQGEPTSILGRLSTGTNRLFDIIDGDTVVLSSHPIPGNEENVYKTINRLFQRGARVIYEAIAPVHVSGHASQEEMKLMMHLTRPKFFIPAHGELRHLHQHSKIAQIVGIPEENILIIENGMIIEFADGRMQLSDERVPASTVFVDGSGVGEMDIEVLRERETLARDGLVMIRLMMSREVNEVVYDPDITSKGFRLNRDAEKAFEGLRQKVIEAASAANGNIRTEVENAASAFIYNETRRRPLVFVSVTRSL